MSIKQQFFLPNDLQALDLALVGAVAIAKELGVKREGLDGPLRRRLFVIAGEGIADPETLRNRLVKSMNLDRIAYRSEESRRGRRPHIWQDGADFMHNLRGATE